MSAVVVPSGAAVASALIVPPVIVHPPAPNCSLSPTGKILTPATSFSTGESRRIKLSIVAVLLNPATLVGP